MSSSVPKISDNSSSLPSQSTLSGSPGETEKAILEIDGVQQALVYGKANSILGNVLCAEVQLVEGSTLTELEIRTHLKEQLQDFKIPRRIKFVESFSLTRTGKIKRS